MILPSKHIKTEKSLIYLSAKLLTKIKKEATITALWEKSKSNKITDSFELFILGIDLLFMLDLIELKRGLIKRKNVN